MKTIKRLMMLLIAIALFVAGYVVGGQKADDMGTLLKNVKSEMGDRTSDLEQEIRPLRLRIHEYGVRHRLASAHAALAERNYGLLQKELKKAKEEMGKVQDLSDAKTKKRLSKVASRLEDLMEDSKKTNPDIIEPLSSIRFDFDHITEK